MASESTCFLMKNDFYSTPWSPGLPDGVHLEITHHPTNLRTVVNLIIAMERIKGAKKPTMGTEFRDGDLLNYLLEAFEEQIVLKEEDTPSVCNAAPTNVPTLNFESEKECSITDIQNRSWVLMNEAIELHAMLLQGGNNFQKVSLNLSRYISAVGTTRIPVALNIKGTQLYLSCSKSGTTPILQLEEVSNKDLLKTINTESEISRFLFYRTVTGQAVNTLESFDFSGWFISTAIQEDNRVDMCQVSTPNRVINFNIHSN